MNCRKTLEGASHPDRDAQFHHVDAEVQLQLSLGEPVISVDTKKKELVGPFRHGGKELRPKGQPTEVLIHDFFIEGLGRTSPYGVYDLAANEAWVSVGVDHDTAAFAVEEHPPLVDDDGPAFPPRGHAPARHRRLRWQQRLPHPALEARVAAARRRDGHGDRRLPLPAGHPPSGTRSSTVSSAPSARTGGASPHEAIVNLIAATTTRTGLRVRSDLDTNVYPKGVTVIDAEMGTLNIRIDPFHGEWNCTLLPRDRLPSTEVVVS